MLLIEVAKSAGRQNCAGRNSDEGVNHVPGAVDVRDLVRDKFDRRTERAATPITHQLVSTCSSPGSCKSANRPSSPSVATAGVEIDARNPRGAHGDCDCGDQLASSIIAIYRIFTRFYSNFYPVIMPSVQNFWNTPAFDVESAAAIAEEHFGVRATCAVRCRANAIRTFFLRIAPAQKFVLKIANALEEPAFLDAQNPVLKHLAKASLVLPASGAGFFRRRDDRRFKRSIPLRRWSTYLAGCAAR